VSAGVHCVFDQILVRQTDTDFAITAELPIAEDTAVLAVDTQSLNLLQLFFAADRFAGLFHNLLSARVRERCRRAQ
jgi:hypothetical protein